MKKDSDIQAVTSMAVGLTKMFFAFCLFVLLIGAMAAACYFAYKYVKLVHILSLVIVILLIALGVACFYLYRFANIIIVFEDDISSTLDTLTECDDSLANIISLRLFFENEQIRPILETARNEVSMCRFKVRQMANRFVERSQQKYVIYEEPIEVEKVRGIPGTIDDELVTNNILGYKQMLGEDADVYFATEREVNQQNKINIYNNIEKRISRK